MLQCPGCTLELPEDDLLAQREHMEQAHLDIIVKRLVAGGFLFDPESGKWIDELA